MRFEFVIGLFCITCVNYVLSIEECFLSDVHALILARGGSKGILKKNLVDFNGLSLLGHTIETIKRSCTFQHIWVSTDSEEIKNEAIKYRALVHTRQAIFGLDTTSSLDAVKEFMDTHQTINYIALFQCTSVFLKEKYIIKAYEKFKKVDCVFSVMRSFHLRWNEYKNIVLPINFDPAKRPRRQDWPGELIENGMFYFTKRSLIQQNILQNTRCSIVEVEAEDSLEIDTYKDLRTAKCLTKANNLI